MVLSSLLRMKVSGAHEFRIRLRLSSGARRACLCALHYCLAGAKYKFADGMSDATLEGLYRQQ